MNDLLELPNRNGPKTAAIFTGLVKLSAVFFVGLISLVILPAVAPAKESSIHMTPRTRVDIDSVRLGFSLKSRHLQRLTLTHKSNGQKLFSFNEPSFFNEIFHTVHFHANPAEIAAPDSCLHLFSEVAGGKVTPVGNQELCTGKEVERGISFQRWRYNFVPMNLETDEKKCEESECKHICVHDNKGAFEVDDDGNMICKTLFVAEEVCARVQIMPNGARLLAGCYGEQSFIRYKTVPAGHSHKFSDLKVTLRPEIAETPAPATDNKDDQSALYSIKIFFAVLALTCFLLAAAILVYLKTKDQEKLVDVKETSEHVFSVQFDDRQPSFAQEAQ